MWVSKFLRTNISQLCLEIFVVSHVKLFVCKEHGRGVHIEVWSLCFWVLWSSAKHRSAYLVLVRCSSWKSEPKLCYAEMKIGCNSIYHYLFKKYVLSLHRKPFSVLEKPLLGIVYSALFKGCHGNVVDSFEHWKIRDIVDLFRSCFFEECQVNCTEYTHKNPKREVEIW